MAKLTPEGRNALVELEKEIKNLATLRGQIALTMASMELVAESLNNSDSCVETEEVEDNVISLVAAADAFEIQAGQFERNIAALLVRPKLFLVK